MQCSALAFSDLGVHVDGFIANVAHTFVVGVAEVGALLLNSVHSWWGDVLSFASYPHPLVNQF